MRISFICWIVLAALLSCKKETLDAGLYWNCHQSQRPDSAAIAGKIIGSWTWAKQACFESGKVKTADKNVKVTFSSDNTFNLSEGSAAAVKGNWKIKKTDGNSWRLELSSPSQYLFGRMLFCTEQILFNNSYVDGCDNLFNKSN